VVALLSEDVVEIPSPPKGGEDGRGDKNKGTKLLREVTNYLLSLTLSPAMRGRGKEDPKGEEARERGRNKGTPSP